MVCVIGACQLPMFEIRVDHLASSTRMKHSFRQHTLKAKIRVVMCWCFPLNFATHISPRKKTPPDSKKRPYGVGVWVLGVFKIDAILSLNFEISRRLSDQLLSTLRLTWMEDAVAFSTQPCYVSDFDICSDGFFPLMAILIHNFWESTSSWEARIAIWFSIYTLTTRQHSSDKAVIEVFASPESFMSCSLILKYWWI